MNRTAFIISLLSCLFLGVSPLSALEAGFDFHIGNLLFPAERTADQTDFSGTDFPWGINFALNQQFSPEMSMETGFEADPVTHNSVYTRLYYRQTYFTVGAGPFFGVFNTRETIMKSGLTAFIKLEYPGLVFLQVRSDSSLGGLTQKTGDYMQEHNLFSLGFYVRNAICSLNVETERFSLETTTGQLFDSLQQYSFKIDVFKKNVPYTALITLGYQKMSRSYPAAGDDAAVVHSLSSLLLGTRVNAQINHFLQYYIDLTTSVYTFGQDALWGISNPGPNGFLFNASSGFSVNVDALKQ